MPPLLKPEMLDSGKLKDLQLAMGKELRTTAKVLKGKNLWFVAASNVPLADKTKMSFFIAVKLEAEAKAWELKLKGKKPMALASGTCKLQTKDGVAVQVALDKVKGDRTKALKAAQLAFKLDKKVLVADPLAKDGKADAGSPAATKAPPAVKKAAAPAPAAKKAAAAAQAVDKIAPGLGALVDQAPVDNAEVVKLLQEFAKQGLSKDQLAAALKRTFA